jgi:hypothetical protein
MTPMTGTADYFLDHIARARPWGELLLVKVRMPAHRMARV